MSRDKRLIVVIPLMLALGGAATAVAADLPGLGKPVSEAELALWDMSIGPGGRGQPPSAPYYARCLLYNIGIGRYTGDTSSVEKQ